MVLRYSIIEYVATESSAFIYIAIEKHTMNKNCVWIQLFDNKWQKNYFVG